jgi:hypothetical protein
MLCGDMPHARMDTGDACVRRLPQFPWPVAVHRHVSDQVKGIETRMCRQTPQESVSSMLMSSKVSGDARSSPAGLSPK